MERTIVTRTKEMVAPHEERLWQAVIVSTIEEWISGPLRRSREAKAFLFTDSRDFRLVCQSAGMNADSLRTRLAKLRKQSIAQTDCRVAA